GLPRSETLLYEHLEVDSPYNTYRYPGLPPGPIAAPGEGAIRAVLYPAAHGYYYFVAKNDGSGEHYFAETYEEHLENIERAEANLAARQPLPRRAGPRPAHGTCTWNIMYSEEHLG